MNLICCQSCGVVYNRSITVFPHPDTLYNESGYGIDNERAGYSDLLGKYVPKIKCKACNEDILDDQ